MSEKKGTSNRHIKSEQGAANPVHTQACTQRQYEITEKDLPLSCPPPDKRVWDAHPRVYLPIEKKGSITCPYCGAKYVLQDFNPDY